MNTEILTTENSPSSLSGEIKPEESRRVYLIAGATSFLGSYFVYSRAAQPLTLFVLPEGSSPTETRNALQRRLESCAESYRHRFRAEEWKQRISLIDGDPNGDSLSNGSFGLLRQSGVDGFWFFATPEAEGNANLLDNIDRALRLAHRIAARRFIYVSSAFTAGRDKGPRVGEQLHSLPGSLDSSFEEIMCQAEHKVAGFCEASHIDYRILRPSIVLGPSLTMTSGFQIVPGGLIRELSELKSEPVDGNQWFSLIGRPESPVNLITIDQLLEDVDYLIENDFAGGPIYHLTSTRNPTVEDLLRTVLGVVGSDETPRCVALDAEQAPPRKPLEQRFSRFGRYLRDQSFERSLPREDGVTKEELYGYVVECVRELGRENGVEFERRWLEAPDGTWFRSYMAGETGLPAVVLINAIGMPVSLLSPLARLLADHFRILTWESRWAPSPDGVFDAQRCDVNHHMLDLTTLLDFAGVKRAHVIGWCNGAQLALKFASSSPQRTRSLVLLNGTFNLPESVTRTAFEKNMRKLMPKIATNKSLAEVYYRMVAGARFRSPGVGSQTEPAGQSSGFITCRNPALRHLTNAPFKTPELLYRYANMITRTFEESALTPGTKLPVRVSVFSGGEDQVSHPDTSREIARRIENASLTILDGGDHHALHDDGRLQEMVFDFLMEIETASESIEKERVAVT